MMLFEAHFIQQIIPLVLPLVFTGMLSGFMAGLLGVGGGIIIVPILAYLLEISGIHSDMPMHVAVGSSLAIIVPTSVISARSHMSLGNVDFDVIRQLGPFVFVGAFGGAVVASVLDNQALRLIFGLLAVIIGISFIVRVVIIRTRLPDLAGRSVMGSMIGLISALVGIGGGSLTVPCLVMCGWSMRRAVGTSALMGLVIAIPGMVSFMIVGFGSVPDLPLSVGFIWLPAVVIIASAAYFTTPLGARFSVKIDQSQLRRIFGVFLILVGLRLAYGGIQSGGLSLFGG